MKKMLVAVTMLLALNTQAQILNNSFENWSLDTFYLEDGVVFGLPADTSISNAPDFWTTSNVATDLDSLGHIVLVTQSNVAYAGSSAIQMRTDHATAHVLGTAINMTMPGFAVNGDFPIDPLSLILNAGQVISPVSLKGAGHPVDKRLAKIKGYYDYKPAYNPNTGSNDTCIVWATLRRGPEIIADAIFKSTDSTSGYQAFEADFKYVSCNMPDTLVILLASSVPNIGDIADTTTGLVPGSVFMVDSLSYDTLDAAHNFPPIALDDRDTTTINIADTVNVLANDTDCDNQSLSVAIIKQPANGTATLLGNDIVYTPNLDFFGRDTIVYRLFDADGADTASVFMRIVTSTGISKANEVPLSVYPVPANNELNIQFENPGTSTLHVYDMIGNLVISTYLTKDNNRINIADLPTGFYGLQIVNNKNAVIARGTFVVGK